MASYLKMPKLSDTMSKGKIAKWKIAVGDKVDFGTEIAEIETDKATMTWDVQVSGIVHKIYVAEGEDAILGAPLVLVLKPGETPPADADNPPMPEAPVVEVKKTSAAATPGITPTRQPKTAPMVPVTTAIKPISSGDSKVKASPLAKKVAGERGLDLSRIRGSGPGGRIVRNDLEFSQGNGRGTGSGGIGIWPSFPSRADQVIPLSGMRRVIADRLLESKTTIPHFYLNIEIDAEPLMKTRSQVNEALAANGGPKYTVNDFVMRAVVLAAQEVPEVNASFAGDSIYQYGSVSLAVAVAIEGGLVTPVIKNADQKSLADLASDLKFLAGKARDKKLTPDEMQGGTITISNLGSYGIHSFDAIINPPQAAILAIGTISKQPVVNETNQIVPGMRMWVGMSCDHRVIDGAVGATYLGALKKYLETPILLIS
jgi:pyruvate dehydrogenase E2 component (dihydrolipoamide acetyltransferase)